jgi:outer membrane protein assembly factor BamE (lipoprotein component of BamABCDE complex)
MKNLYKVLLLGWAGLMLTSRVAGEDQPAPEKEDTRARTKADLDAVRAYLAKNYPGKTWDKGPERIESPEINAAYGKDRFYFVFTAKPRYEKGTPPARFEIERLQKALEEYAAKRTSLTVRVDDDGKVTSLISRDDFQRGLKKMTGEQDFTTAGVALLELENSGEICPGPLPANRFQVVKLNGGQIRVLWGLECMVTFDPEGRVVDGPRKVRSGPR